MHVALRQVADACRQEALSSRKRLVHFARNGISQRNADFFESEFFVVDCVRESNNSKFLLEIFIFAPKYFPDDYSKD